MLSKESVAHEQEVAMTVAPAPAVACVVAFHVLRRRGRIPDADA